MREKKELPIGSPFEFAAIAAAAAALGALSVWAGLGAQDGFLGASGQVLGRKLLKQLIWLVPCAMAAGALLNDYYSRMLAPGQTGAKAPGLVLLSIGRIVLHFFVFAMLAMLVWLLTMAWFVASRVLGFVLRRPIGPQTTVAAAIPVAPIWFLVYPMNVLKVETEEGDGGDIELPVTIARGRLLMWLPSVCATIGFMSAFVGEDSGERVDPYWLTAGAAFWLGDYLITALRVMPALRARRGLDP